MKVSNDEREEAIAKMREWLQPGDTVYTVLDRVSRSGMSRDIRVVLLKTDNDGKPYMLHPNYFVQQILGYRRAKHGDGLVVGGCGMDMGFHVVFGLSRCLFPAGFGIEGKLPSGHKIRPKTPAMAAKAVARGAEFYGRNGDKSGWDPDGGYALKQRWL